MAAQWLQYKHLSQPARVYTHHWVKLKVKTVELTWADPFFLAETGRLGRREGGKGPFRLGLGQVAGPGPPLVFRMEGWV